MAIIKEVTNATVIDLVRRASISLVTAIYRDKNDIYINLKAGTQFTENDMEYLGTVGSIYGLEFYVLDDSTISRDDERLIWTKENDITFTDPEAIVIAREASVNKIIRVYRKDNKVFVAVLNPFKLDEKELKYLEEKGKNTGLEFDIVYCDEDKKSLYREDDYEKLIGASLLWQAVN